MIAVMTKAASEVQVGDVIQTKVGARGRVGAVRHVHDDVLIIFAGDEGLVSMPGSHRVTVISQTPR